MIRKLILIFVCMLFVGIVGTANAADPYATYNPDGYSGAPYMQFYGGETYIRS